MPRCQDLTAWREPATPFYALNRSLAMLRGRQVMHAKFDATSIDHCCRFLLQAISSRHRKPMLPHFPGSRDRRRDAWLQLLVLSFSVSPII